MDRARQAHRLLLLFVVYGWGCSAEEPSPGALAKHEATLLWPTPEDGMPSVVFVRAYPNDQWNTGYGSCSASLIAPRVVLTAKHCVKPANQPVSPPSHVAVGIGSDASAFDAQLYRAESIVVAPGEWPERDVAVITLEDAVHGIEPMPLKLTPPHDDVGSWATEYGYGITGVDPNNSRKNRQDVQVDAVTDTGVWVKNAGCVGDSGGPLVNQHGQNIGVYAVLYANQDSNFCAEGITGMFNRIDIEADMINQALRRAEGCRGDQEVCGDHADNDCDLRVDEGCLPEVENPDAPAILYEHCSFGGWGASLEEGTYSAEELAFLYVPERQASSFKVKPGYRVVAYAEDALAGESTVVEGEHACLVDLTFNDRIVSLRVERIVPPDEPDEHDAGVDGPDDEGPNADHDDAGVPAESDEGDASTDDDAPGDEQDEGTGEQDDDGYSEESDALAPSRTPPITAQTCQLSEGQSPGALHLGFAFMLLTLVGVQRRRVRLARRRLNKGENLPRR
jgi:V8-like Glu-specific endopeptidase